MFFCYKQTWEEVFKIGLFCDIGISTSTWCSKMESQILHAHLFGGDYLEMIQRNQQDEEQNFSTIPFLQMLQSDEFTNPFSLLLTEPPSFDKLCKLQFMERNLETTETQIESCITNTTHDAKTEVFQYPDSVTCLDQGETNSVDNGKLGPVISCREKRKRKRTTRVCKNKEEVENQRMTHIAVERNRRRQMNDYLSTLRSLMPPSYVQRGDQASIIGGAIDFVKEMEQRLQSLQSQSQKRRKSLEEQQFINHSHLSLSPDEFFTDKHSNDNYFSSDGGGEYRAENRSENAKIEVIVIQTHVNLKVQCSKKNGQLLKAIVALEELRLTVLHLNVTSFESSIFYSFNLKIEDDCKIGSADRIARSVHQIFDYINGSSGSSSS